MATIATIAGVAITVPGILSGVWSVLKTAYDLYGSVESRRAQVGILLDRCKELFEKIAQHVSDHKDLSPSMQQGVDNLERVCKDVKTILEKLNKKKFLWCMINTDKIDTEINNVKYKILSVFGLFNFLSHLDRDQFQQELRRAQQQDRVELAEKLDHLSANDQQILDAIQDQGGAQARMEELLVAIMKRVNVLGTEASSESKFFTSAGNALQRKVSGSRPPIISEDWVVTSFEVDFEPINPIGRGSFGTVFRGRWQAARVAIKQMYTDDARMLSDHARKVSLIQEYLNLKRAETMALGDVQRGEIMVQTAPSKYSQPLGCLSGGVEGNLIVAVFGGILGSTRIGQPFLVMQYCQFGNICSYLRELNPDANRIDLCHDVVAGMSYLHARGIIHADLKGVNILVDDKRSALVADFGLSTVIDDIRSKSGYTSTTHAGTARGTLRWMAPECLDGKPPTKASDIYSLGITIWEIFSGEVPFSQISDLVIPRIVVDKQERPTLPALLKDFDVIWDLIQRCWAPEFVSRPSIDAVETSLAPYTTKVGSIEVHKLYINHDKSESTVISASQFQQKWTRSLQSRSPQWIRGTPNRFIDVLTIPELPLDKTYRYRVVKGATNLGIRPTYKRNADGSQTINLLEYNQGYGIADTTPIKVYAVDSSGTEGPGEGEDSDEHEEILVAHWNPNA